MTAPIMPINLYPPGNLVDVFAELQRASSREAEEIQYLLEKANARIGEFRATVQKARTVTRLMRVDATHASFRKSAHLPELTRRSGSQNEEIIFLRAPDDENGSKESDRIEVSKRGGE